MSEKEKNIKDIFDSGIEDRNFSGELKEGSSFHTSESLFNDLINHKKKKKKKKKNPYIGKRRSNKDLKNDIKVSKKPNISNDIKTSKISYDFNREERIKKKAFEEFEKTRKQQVKNTITKLKREAREGIGLKSNNVFANSSFVKNISIKENKTGLKIDDFKQKEFHNNINLDNLNIEREKRRIAENKKFEENLLNQQKKLFNKNFEKDNSSSININSNNFINRASREDTSPKNINSPINKNRIFNPSNIIRDQALIRESFNKENQKVFIKNEPKPNKNVEYGNSSGIKEGRDFHTMNSTFEKARSRVDEYQKTAQNRRENVFKSSDNLNNIRKNLTQKEINNVKNSFNNTRQQANTRREISNNNKVNSSYISSLSSEANTQRARESVENIKNESNNLLNRVKTRNDSSLSSSNIAKNFSQKGVQDLSPELKQKIEDLKKTQDFNNYQVEASGPAKQFSGNTNAGFDSNKAKNFNPSSKNLSAKSINKAEQVARRNYALKKLREKTFKESSGIKEGRDFHTMESTFNKTSERLNRQADGFISSSGETSGNFRSNKNPSGIESKLAYIENRDKIKKINANKVLKNSQNYNSSLNNNFGYKKASDNLRRKPEKNLQHAKLITRNVKQQAYLKNKEDLSKLYDKRKIFSDEATVNPIDELSRQDLINHRKELKRKSQETFGSLNISHNIKERENFNKENIEQAKNTLNNKINKSYANLDDWKVDPSKINSKVIKKAKDDIEKNTHKFTSSALEKTMNKKVKRADKNSFYRDKGYLYHSKVIEKGELGTKARRKKQLMRKMQLNSLNRTKNMKIIAMEAARRGSVTPSQARYVLLQSGSIKSLIKKIDETSIISSTMKKEKKEVLIHRNKRDSYHRYAKNIGKVDLNNEKEVRRFYGKIKDEQRKYFNTSSLADSKNKLKTFERRKKLRRRINRQLAYSKGIERKAHKNRINKLSKNDKSKIYNSIKKHKSFENISKRMKKKPTINEHFFEQAKNKVNKKGKAHYKKKNKSYRRQAYKKQREFRRYKEKINSKNKSFFKSYSEYKKNSNSYSKAFEEFFKRKKVNISDKALKRLKRMSRYRREFAKRFKKNLKYGLGMLVYDYSTGMILGRTTEDEGYFKALGQLYGRHFISRLLLRDGRKGERKNSLKKAMEIAKKVGRILKIKSGETWDYFANDGENPFYKYLDKNRLKKKSKAGMGKLRGYIKKNKGNIFQRFKYRSRKFGYLALRSQQAILKVNDDEASESMNQIFESMYTGGKLGVYTAKKGYKVAKKTAKNARRVYRFVRKNLSAIKKLVQQAVKLAQQAVKAIGGAIKSLASFFATPPGIITLIVLVVIIYVMLLIWFISSLKLNETYDYGTITYNRITKLDYDANMGESQRYRDANIDALNKLQAIRDGAWSSDDDLTVIVPRRKKLPIPEPYNPTSDGLFVRTDANRLVQFLETVYQDDTIEQITDYALETNDIDAGKEYESNFGLEKIPPTESEYNRQQKNLKKISKKSASEQVDNSTLIRKKSDGSYTNTKELSQDAIDAGVKEDPIDLMLDIFQKLHPPNSYTIDDANKDSLITKEISKDGQIKKVKIYYADRKDYPFDYFYGYEFAEAKTGGDQNTDPEVAVDNNTSKKLELPEGGEEGLGLPSAGEDHTGREMLFRLQGSDTRFRTMDANQSSITGRLTNPFSSKELADDPLNPGKQLDLTDPLYSVSWLIRHQDGYRHIDYDKEDEKNKNKNNRSSLFDTNKKTESTSGTSTDTSTDTSTERKAESTTDNKDEAPTVSTVVSNPTNPYDFPTTYVRRRFGFETDKIYKPASDNVSDVSGFETKNLNLNYNESQNYLKKNGLPDFGEYYDKKTGLVMNSIVDVVTMPGQKVYSPMEGKLVVAGNGFLGITAPTLQDERVGGGYVIIANPDRYGAEGASSTAIADLTDDKFYSPSGKIKGFKHGTLLLIGGFDSESLERLRIRAYDGENNWVEHYDELGTLKKVLKDEDPEEKARNEGSHKSDVINSEPGEISHPILGDMYQGLGPRGLGWGRPSDIAGDLIEKRGKWTVTAYSDDPSENGLGPGGVSTTATDKTKLPEVYKGVKDKDNLLRIGDVAVPRKNGKPIIPYGTYLWIDGYGFARATDTGGAMKGDWSTPNPENRVLDILMHNRDCNKWGRKVVEVIQFKGNPFENKNFDITGAGFTGDTGREELDEEIQETDTLDKKVKKLSKKVQKLTKKISGLKAELAKNPKNTGIQEKIAELEKELTEKQAKLDKMFAEHEEEAKKALENMDVKEDDLQSVLYLQLYYVYPHIEQLAKISNINVPVFKQTLGKLAGVLSDSFNTAYTYINPAMYMETGVLDYPDNKVQSYMLETGYGSYQTDINVDDYFLDASNNVNEEDHLVQCSNDDGWTLPISNNTFDGLKVVSSFGKRNKDYISEASSQEVQAFLNQARSYLGKYTYSQLDCSGYARAVLRDMGIDFPRIPASKFLNKDQPWWNKVVAYRDVRESGGDPLEGIKPGDIIVMIKGVNGYATNLSITGHIAINVGMDKENGVNRGNNVMYHSTIGRTGNGPTQGVISDTYKNATGWIRFFDAGPVENDAEIDPNNWEYSPTLEFTSSTINRPIVGSMSKASVISTGTTQEGHAYVLTKQADESGNNKYLVYEGLDPATLRVEKGDVLKPGTELGISAGSVVKVYSPKDPSTQLVTDSQELGKFNNVLEVIHPDIAKKLHSKFTEGARKAEQKEKSNKIKYNTSGEVFSKEAVCEVPDTYTGTVTTDIIMMEGYPWMSQMASIPNEYHKVKIHGKSKTYLQNGCGGWANAMGLTKALGRPIHVPELEGGFLKGDLVMEAGLMSRFINNKYGSEVTARASSSSNFRNSQSEIIEALNSGGYAVIHSRPPDRTWTRRPSGEHRSGGHYVVLIGYDPENHPDKPFRVHDSANNNPSNTGWFTWNQVKAGAVGGSNMIVRKK